MKKILSISILLFISISTSFAQDSTLTKGWSATFRASFVNGCIKTAKVTVGEDSARNYCYCMVEKIEKKYPTEDAAGKITAADMATPEMKKEIQDCLSSNSTWTSNDRADFLTDCINSAKDGLGEQRAKNYCECMLFKLEKKFPSVSDIPALTKEATETPEFKKMVQDCLRY